MRYVFFTISAIIILAGARSASCDWEELFQVNTDNYDKQASRGVDCPWSIAADDSGNVYAIWEDKRDPEEIPEVNIYSRKKDRSGNWEQDDHRLSYEEGDVYGHPSICVLPGDYPPKLLACYVREHHIYGELRGNTFDDFWGDPSYFISDEVDIS